MQIIFIFKEYCFTSKQYLDVHCALLRTSQLVTIKPKAAHDSPEIMGRNIEWIFPKGFSECKCVNNISKMATQWIMHRPHRLGREGRGWKLQNIQCRWSPAQPSYRTEISTAPNIEGIQGVAEHMVNLTGLTRNQKLFQTKRNLPVFFSITQKYFISISDGSIILKLPIFLDPIGSLVSTLLVS